MRLRLRFIGADSKAVIKSINDLPVEQIALLLPSDGFVRVDGECYKVKQIIKSIDTHGVAYVTRDYQVDLTIDVYIKRIDPNDMWLGSK
jgi:hypothetical protein